VAIGYGRLEEASDERIPALLLAGAEVVGEYRCATCGYGVAVRRALPACPMCGGVTWEPSATSAFVSH
jgi:rubrerythrin